ncbi:MAG: response regulator [Phycisphaerae bacterium]
MTVATPQERIPSHIAPGAALDALGAGVCVVNEHGEVLYANAVMRAYPPEVLAQVSHGCRGALTHARPAAAPAPDAAARTIHRFPLSAPDDRFFEVTATTLTPADGSASQIVAVVWDVTRTQQLGRRIDAIDGAGRDLVQLGAQETAHLTIEERTRLLEEKIRQYLHDVLHFDNYVVLLIESKTNKLEFVFQQGMSERSQTLDIHVSPSGNGISGYVAATGKSYVCGDVLNDPLYLPGLDIAKSSLTVPLKIQDRVIGVFNIESATPNAFNDEDRQFVEMFARYVAVAIHTLELLVSERFDAAGRLGDDVSTEIAGPLNDILTDVAAIMEQYISNEDLRARLAAICDHVSTIKKGIREVTQPRGGIRGLRDDTPTTDPDLAGKRILVADDEEIIRETIGGVLTRKGCQVDTACDGVAAINLIESRPYDAVLADIKMPHKNGYEIFAAVKARNPDTPVLLMTGFGYDPNHSIVRARREGLAGVLFKPFKVDQLLDELRRAVTTPGQAS